MQTQVSISLNDFKRQLDTSEPVTVEVFSEKNCGKLISMPFMCYTVAQYHSHRYHICIFMQTFTWIKETVLYVWIPI